MKKVFALLAVLVLISVSRANDSAIQGAGGQPTAIGSLKKVAPLSGEHPTVRMVRERVAITVNATNYDVVADFEFHNDGAARNVLMGFPEGAGGDTDFGPLEKRSAFVNFRTSVDGRKIRARRVAVGMPEYDHDFQAYWVKSVPFKRHQSHRVRVSYRAPLGSSVDGDYVYYDFTGGNWKGKVEESLLSVTFAAPATYILQPIDETLKPTQWRRGNSLFYRWRNWQAQDGFSLRFQSNLPGTLMRANEEKDLNETWALWQGTRTLTVPAAKGSNPYRVSTSLRNDYLMRDGRVFVSMRTFAEELNFEIARREAADKQKQKHGEFNWDTTTQTAILKTAGAKSKIVRVQAGSRKFKVDNTSYEFPATPFMGGVGDNQSLYAPLDSLTAALGGKMKVNLKTRRAWFQVPL